MMKRSIVGVLAVLLLVLGCSQSTQRLADESEREGDWDQAVLYYLELVQEQPENISYRAALMRARIRASQMHFELGKEFKEAGVLDQALIELQQAVQLDTTNQYAQVELRKVREQIAAAAGGAQVLTLEQMKEKVRAERQPPELSPRSTEPISMDFPEPVSVQNIYRALGKAFGINVIFDPNLRDQEIAITLQDVVAKDALEILMRSAGHFYKVVDEHSILIAADTPQNRRAYEDLVIQTFFLSNAQPKDTFNMLRQLVGAKNIATNEELNAIVVRDTADRVKVAERIIQTNDKARGEVVVDVELLQINTNTMLELGMSLSEYQVVQTLDPTPVPLSELEFLNQSNWMLTIPSFIYDFMKSSSDAELLARPQLRISDGEQARLHIGDQVPIPVTTFNTANTIGGNIVPVTSFSYQDVGIRIEIESRIHHNQEVTLDIHVEVSQVTGDVQGSQGTTQPIISTRNIESTIRLRDGETNFLAGLLRTDEINGQVGIPGLSDIPVIGRLFSKNSNQTQRTDLVITLTPHIVRTADVTEEDLAPIWVGTESNITFRGGSTQVESDAESPFEQPADDEQLQEMIRERLENLPRGLQEQQSPVPGEPQIEAPTPQRNVLDEEEQEESDEPPGPGLASIGPSSGPSPGLGGVAGALERLALATSGAEVSRAPFPVRLSFAPGRRMSVPVGQLFAVELRVEADVEVSHLPIILGFDPEVLEIESVYEGDFFQGTGMMLADHSTPGRLVLGASRLGQVPGVVGEGSVVSIFFRAVARGRTRLHLEERRAMGPDLAPVGPIRSGSLTVTADPGAEPIAAPEKPLRPRIA
jgi:general secretion pathway protein D